MDENFLSSTSYQKQKTFIEYLLFYISYFLQHKRLIIIITLLAAIGSVVYSLISLKLPPEESYLPNYYRADSVFIVEQGHGADVQTMLASLGFDLPLGRDDLNYGELAIRVFRSRPFLDEIVDEHNLIQRYEIEENVKTRSREIVLNSSDIQYEARTGTLTIGYTDIDPVFARDVVQSIVTNLQEWFEEWEGTTTMRQIDAMETKIEEVSKEITRLEEEIQAFQSKYGVMSVDQIAEAQTAMITDLQTQLIQTEVAIKNYSGFSNIEDQELIQLRAERDSLRELIQQIEQGTGLAGRQMPSQNELPALAINYSHLRMAHEIQMRIYQNLQEQYEVQKLSTTNASVFSVLEPAEIPEEKSGPSRGKLCMIVTALGFFASIGIAVLIDGIRNVKNDPDKMQILKSSSE